MSSIGPQLPPHLSKRKRSLDDSPPASSSSKQSRREPGTGIGGEIDVDSDEDDVGPAAPVSKPSSGPSLPSANGDEIDLASDSESDTGPAPPPSSRPQPQPQSRPRPQPQPQSQPQQQNLSSDSDSDSDDYGPAPPSATTSRAKPIGPALPPSEPTPQRDDWMLAPPTSTGYSERDTTRMRPRKFASKPSATANTDPSAPSIWTETPEEKLRRLQDSVLGRAGPADQPSSSSATSAARQREDERERAIAANIEAKRGKSLYDEHHQQRRDKGVPKEEEEDDPSQRGFDREKDMAVGGKIGTAKRRELVAKSTNFGGKFQKGSFL